MDLATLICKAILIIIGILAVIVFGACALVPLMMGKNNKSIADQEDEKEEINNTI